MSFTFEVLLDTSLSNIDSSIDADVAVNKYIVSIINDFEDRKWRADKFQNFIWDNVAESALSYAEREAVVDASHTGLVNAAKNLRLSDKENDISAGSEIAEIVLYGLMKHKYGGLPVVPKIFYKQNAQDNAKGVDSVHIILEDNGSFSLWFGEAKFYNSIEDARLPEIIKSVGKSLDTEKLKKENSIITGVSDLNDLVPDAAILNEIKATLSNKNSIDTIKPLLNIPVLLLHECEITQNGAALDQSYINAISAYHEDRAKSYFCKQTKKIGDIHLYSEVKFHLVIFPVASKDEIVERFVENAQHYKRQ